MELQKLKGIRTGLTVKVLSVIQLGMCFTLLGLSILALLVIKGVVPSGATLDLPLGPVHPLYVLCSFVSSLIWIVLYIIFLIWYYKAYGNLDRLGQAMDHGKGWAVWGFFVPFLNFVRPVQIGLEILAKSTLPGKPVTGRALIFGWWIIYLVSAFFDVAISNDSLLSLENSNNLTASALYSLVSAILNGVFYVLLFRLVSVINALQGRRVEAIVSGESREGELVENRIEQEEF